MAKQFSAIITNVIKDPNAIVVLVTYYDGQSEKVLKEYRLTTFDLNSFKRTVQDQIAQLNTTDLADIQVSIPLGPFDPTITPPVETPIQKFARDVQLLRNYQRAIDLKIIDSNNTDYATQLQNVKSAFSTDFISAI